MLTRSGLDWTAKYPATAAALAKLSFKTASVEGEPCGVRPDGVTSFEIMQQASDSRGGALVHLAFDLLELDGVDVAAMPSSSARSGWRQSSKTRLPGLRLASMRAAMARHSVRPHVATASRASFQRELPLTLLRAAPFIVSGAAKQRLWRCAASLIITSCASVSLTLMIQPFLSSRRPDKSRPSPGRAPDRPKPMGRLGHARSPRRI